MKQVEKPEIKITTKFPRKLYKEMEDRTIKDNTYKSALIRNAVVHYLNEKKCNSVSMACQTATVFYDLSENFISDPNGKLKLEKEMESIWQKLQ